MLQKKPRIFAFDFIRGVCAVLIIFYHFSNQAENGGYFFFYFGADNNFGSVLVTVFFMLSGASLWYTHSGGVETKAFYKKRAWTILPAFYLSYAIWVIIR